MPSSRLHRITTLRSRAYAPLLVAVGLAGPALVVAGCGSSSPTTATTATTDSAGAPPPQNMVSDAFKFASCMRNHGVTNFPDPQVSTSGTGTSIRMMAPDPKSSPAMQAGIKACRGIVPMPKNAGQQVRTGPPEQALLELARCVRSHGYPRFPDPTAQGQLTTEMITGAGIDMQAPGFLSTAESCASVTHGQITAAMVAQAVNHSESGQ
jgi:hypothetical protein